MTIRLIVTGPPGSGKTTLLDALRGEATVVAEAATDVVTALLAEGVRAPERHPDFLGRTSGSSGPDGSRRPARSSCTTGRCSARSRSPGSSPCRSRTS